MLRFANTKNFVFEWRLDSKWNLWIYTPDSCSIRIQYAPFWMYKLKLA
jgi:hypothetical protein